MRGRPVFASSPIQQFILSQKKKTASLKDPVRKIATDSTTEDLINISVCAVVCSTVGKKGPGMMLPADWLISITT